MQSALRYLPLLLDENCVELQDSSVKPGASFAPTWQPKNGEIRSALCKAGALPHAAPPQSLILEDGRDRVVVQVLRAPHIHGSGHHAPRNTQRRNDEPHHLADGCGHGGSLRERR